jgi:transcriptional regulator with XRE-family HTH domain
MKKELGETIKALRLAKGWTLKDFSEKADLSVSFLSMVERGRSSIALVSLKKIAAALDEPMATFFPEQEMAPEGSEAGITRSYETNIRAINGYYIYNQIGAPRKDFCMDTMVITLLPGQNRDEVIQFSHEGEELTYVLEGVLSMFIDGIEHLMYPGDAYHGFGMTPHNFVNLTNQIVRVLYVLTPPLWEEVERHTAGLSLNGSDPD